MTPEEAFFFEVDGDQRHMHEVTLGGYDAKEAALADLIFKEDNFRYEPLTREDAEAALHKGAFLVVCGEP